LHPTETQREAHLRHFSSQLAESYKAAEAQSVFLSVVSKSVLLYGRKSISYMYGSDGQTKRMELPLQSHGTEIEFPRMQYLDPFGLDYMLRIFEVIAISVEKRWEAIHSQVRVVLQVNSSNNASVSCKSFVSNPSVNQPWISANIL
jgi:hypothetical protein